MAYQTAWGVFDHPADYPSAWIAREFEIRPGEFRKTDHFMTAPIREDCTHCCGVRGPQCSHHFFEKRP